jgi:MotA/TolQ/ExbB proton channel family
MKWTGTPYLGRRCLPDKVSAVANGGFSHTDGKIAGRVTNYQSPSRCRPGDRSVRQTVIRFLLPFIFCLLPLLGAALVAVAIPRLAMQYYLERIVHSPMDWLILGLGAALFLVQMLLCWRALRWRGMTFDERPDRWLSHLAQAAEWFPLLGLLGTVAGILQTFGSITGPVSPAEIIERYAPAITATGSGLFMALINILPTWLVLLGREIIQSLGGKSASSLEEAPP